MPCTHRFLGLTLERLERAGIVRDDHRAEVAAQLGHPGCLVVAGVR